MLPRLNKNTTIIPVKKQVVTKTMIRADDNSRSSSKGGYDDEDNNMDFLGGKKYSYSPEMKHQRSTGNSNNLSLTVENNNVYNSLKVKPLNPEPDF